MNKQKRIILTGVQIQQNGLNPCFVEGCKNNAMTAVRGEKTQWQEHVCGWHLKEKIENKEWIVCTK
jgi:hypothetical protein